MKYIVTFFILFAALHTNAQTFYIVRHAEKQTDTAGVDLMMRNDPPLTREGLARAQALGTVLKKKSIGYIFSTPTTRTRTTALGVADVTGIRIEMYGPKPDNMFLQKLRSLDKNVLIVGHSNTVDDIVNDLVGKQVLTDLADNEYDNLFIVKHKGNKWSWERKKYGKKIE